MSATHELLAECHAIGIELLVAGDDRLIIDAPQDALTPDLLGYPTNRSCSLMG